MLETVLVSGVLGIEFQVASDLRRVLEAVLMSGVLKIGVSGGQ